MFKHQQYLLLFSLLLTVLLIGCGANNQPTLVPIPNTIAPTLTATPTTIPPTVEPTHLPTNTPIPTATNIPKPTTPPLPIPPANMADGLLLQQIGEQYFVVQNGELQSTGLCEWPLLDYDLTDYQAIDGHIFSIKADDVVVGEPCSAEKATYLWTPYDDQQLNFSLRHPVTWTSSHANGTTTFADQNGQPQVRLRKYPSRDGLLSAETIARWSLPPSVQATLILTPTTINLAPAYSTNTATTFIDGHGHHLAFEILTDSAEADLILKTLSIRPTHSNINHNYYLLSSENWLAEEYSGENTPITFTLQRRDGNGSYTILERPNTQGLGGYLPIPLFFDNTERYFYYNEQAIADGCGTYFGGNDLQRVDLSSGAQITLTDTSGIGHTLANDGHTVAFFRKQGDNQFTLHLFNLLTQARKTIDFSLEGENPKAGSLVFSPDMHQIAFTVLQNACAGGAWSIGIIDLVSAEITTHYTGSGFPWFYPVAWSEDYLLTVGEIGSDKYHQLNLKTNTLSDK